jgi:hypothetical protein
MLRLSLDHITPRESVCTPRAFLGDLTVPVGWLLPAGRHQVAKDDGLAEIERCLNAPVWQRQLRRAGEFWGRVPKTVRLTMAVMTILFGVFAASPGGGQAGPGNLQAALSGGWEGVQRNILRRAAVALTDDFRSGLADWQGEDDWARSWAYDQSGFVRTGPLALYTPSLQLTDYRMEFLGQIEKRSLGWVVRAADLKNYYAVKLTVSSGGPVPDVLVQRYPVLQGKAEPVKSRRLTVPVRTDTLYRVQVAVHGDDFALMVQDQMVDSWTDARLPRGGIGFFSAKGELARLRWVGVWHQYDTLGRLCALLAPSTVERETGVNR